MKIKCVRCKKTFQKKDTIFAYTLRYCKRCFKIADKENKEEVDKMFNKAIKQGII